MPEFLPGAWGGKRKLKKKYNQKGFEYLNSSHAQQGGNIPGQGENLKPKGLHHWLQQEKP